MARIQRARSARAVANDQAIRDAAVNEVLRVGVDHVSLRDVGLKAGLTHGASYARYEDVDELLVDLWNSQLCERVIALYERCMTAAREPSSHNVGVLFESIRDATPADVAAIQVLLTARRIPTLLEEVEPFVQNYLQREAGDSSEATAAFTRGLTIFATSMVQIFADSQFGYDGDYQAVVEKLILATLETDPREVNEVALQSSKERVIIVLDDDLKSQLAFATFGVVGKSGYTHATISRIARRANCSPGAIYKLYPSKEDLVIAAFRDIMKARWMNISNFVDVLEEGSLTQLLFDSANPLNKVRATFTLEVALAAAHSPRLQVVILSQLGELEAVIPLLENISASEKGRLRYLIRAIAFMTIGVTFLATVTDSMQYTNFNQFAEPFRRAVLKNCVPTWSEMCRQIRELVEQRGF